MKKNEIKKGGHYRAKVSGVLTTVRVDGIREVGGRSNYPAGTAYDVTNLRTGRTTTFRSAAKFREEADAAKQRESEELNHNPAVVAYMAKQRAGGQHEPAPTADCPPVPVKACNMPPQEGDDDPVNPDKLNGPKWGQLFGRQPTEGEQRSDPTQASGTSTAGGNGVPADGRTWTPPADLRGDQARAFRVVTQRIDAGERVTKLCGYAGTGKTYLLAYLAKWARGNNYEVTVVAPTHKAAGVISQKLEDAGATGVEVRTIHSLLGLMLVPDYEHDTGGRILAANDAAKSKLKPGLVICDEASMVGAVLKEHIDRSPSTVRWLFVGDLAQLPPVGEGVSELLDDPDASLEEVIRQKAGSEIINLATRVRSGDTDMEYEPDRDVAHVDDAEALFQSALARFDTDDYRRDPSHARVLVFRNARRSSINLRMRQLLIGAPEPYTAGEWIVMYAAFSPEKSRLNVLCEAARKTIKGTRASGKAWGQFFDAKKALEGQAVPQLHVSEEVRVLSAEDGELALGAWTFGVHRLTVEDRAGGVHVLPVLRADEVTRHRQVLAEQVEEAHELRRQRDEYQQYIAEWADLDKRRKQAWGVYFSLEETFAQVDYAYAMTVHKSQGSTFDHAFVDVPDLMSSGGMQQRILYTAVTRPSKSLTFYA